MYLSFACAVTLSLAIQDPPPPVLGGSGGSERVAPVVQSPAEAGQPKETKIADSFTGLWPSPQLMELLLSRWADRAAAEYKLDAAQQERLREDLVERWTGFLEDNRADLQPLANEFLEMRLGLAPPDADQVKAWSQRAMPALKRVREQIAGTQAQFREMLSPLQRAQFEIDALKTAAGLQIAENKLQAWSEGRFDTDDLWEPLPSMRRERRRERREGVQPTSYAAAAASAKRAQPADQVAAELAAWEKFVADFIREYGLDSGQQTAALSCLKELSERASAHQGVHREQIEDLESRIASSSGRPEDLAQIQRRLVELYGPIDQMFQELKTRLEAIPTAEQRARVAESKQKAADDARIGPPAD